MKEEVKTLIRRTKIFENDAKTNFKNGDYDICMFHLEQTAQLLIKAKLLDIKGSFQMTHSLRKLLIELAEEWKRDKVLAFIKENKKVLRDLERATYPPAIFMRSFLKTR